MSGPSQRQNKTSHFAPNVVSYERAVIEQQFTNKFVHLDMDAF